MKKNFIVVKSYFNSIDSGVFFSKPIVWIYWLIALSNIAIPGYILYYAMDSFYRWGIQWTLFVIEFIVLLFVSIISFFIWTGRKSSLIEFINNNKKTPATFIVAHFIKTAGECLGVWIGIMGFFDTFLDLIFYGGGLSDSAFYGNGFRTILSEFNLVLFEKEVTTSIVLILLFPIIGYFIVLITKFISERLTFLAIIANNTKVLK